MKTNNQKTPRRLKVQSMFCANQDFGNQFYFVAQQTKTKMPDLQTSDRHKTSEPPPKHWSNLQDNFTAKP